MIRKHCIQDLLCLHPADRTIKSRLYKTSHLCLVPKIMLRPLIEKADKYFSSYKNAIIAFSGGVDSSLLAFLSRMYLGKENFLAVISVSESTPEKDLVLAKRFSRQHDIPLKVIRSGETENRDYISNPPDRCFICKKIILENIDKVRREKGFNFIFTGQNMDDHSDYRPGLEAEKLFQEVRAPLAELDFNKQTIRTLARYYGLECWKRPASSCLSTRIPFNQEITRSKLRQINLAESFLHKMDIEVVRVRHFNNKAKIEVPVEFIPTLKNNFDEIEKFFIMYAGFREVEIDNEGYVPGRLNGLIK